MRSNLLKLALLLIATVSTAMCGQQKVTCSPIALKTSEHSMTVRVTGLDNNNGSGVSRIAFELVSIPHTSSRIDSVTAVINGRRVVASDIDGVDFKCYFQWEDNGVIPVEVDFPRHDKFMPTDTVIFHTVHGNYSSSLAPLMKY